MADLNVAIELAGRDSTASSAINSVRGSLGHLTDAANAPVKALGGITEGLGKLGFAAMGISAITQTVAGFATGLVAGNSEMEKYETQLGTLMGSADGARERLKELAEFGARTPFELPEIAAAEKVLLGFGLTGEKVFKLTGKTGEQFREVVGDIAAGTGASFQEIALNMGKFSAGATGEAISRFQEMGVATREQLAAMGVEFSKSGELLSPLPVAMQAITKLAQDKFGGGMDKLSKTFEGQMSTLSDGINQAKVAIMQPIFNVLRDSLANVNAFIASGAFQKGIQDISAFMVTLVEKGINLAVQGFQTFSRIVSDTVAKVGPTIQMLSERFSAFFGSLTQGATLAQTVNAAFGDLIPPNLNTILDTIDTAFSGIKSSFLTLIDAFNQGGFAGVWQTITASMAEFAPTGERLASALSSIGSAIKALVPQPIQDFVSNLIGIAEGATGAASPLSFLAEIVNTFSSAIESATNFVRDHVAVQAILLGSLTAAGVAWGISAAIQTYHKAVTIATSVTTAYTAVQAALNVVLTANPIGLVIVALAGLTAGLIYAYKNSEEFRNVVDNAFSTLKTVVSAAIAISRNSLEALSTTIETVGKIVDTTFTFISNIIPNTITAVTGAVNTGFEMVRSSIESKMNAINEVIRGVWDKIPTDIQDDLVTIVGYIGTQLAAAQQRVSERFGAIQATVATAMQTVTGVLQGAWDAIVLLVGNAVETVRADIETKWGTISSLISTVMAAVNEVISKGWELVRSTIEEKTDAAFKLIREWGKNLGEFLGGLKNTVSELATSIGNSIVSGIQSGIGALWDALQEWAMQKIRDLLGAMAKAIKSGSPSQMAADMVGEPIPQGVSVGIQRGLPTTIAVAQAAAQKIVQAFSLKERFKPDDFVPFGIIKEYFGNNTRQILNNLYNFIGNVENNFSSLNHFLRGWINDAIAHRTELLRIFNFPAYLRGEGTAALQELTEITDNFMRDTTLAAKEAAFQLIDLAAKTQAAVAQARDEAYAAAADIVAATNKQITDIQTSAALQKEIKAQRDAFTTMQRQAKDFFDAQQTELQNRLRQQENIARINYTAGLKLSRVGLAENPGVTAAQLELDTRTQLLKIDFELSRDLQRAKTDDERAQIMKRADEAKLAIADQLDEEKYLAEQTKALREELQRQQIEAERQNALQALQDQQTADIAVANETATLRQEILARQLEFQKMQAEQAAAFEQGMEGAAFARQVNQMYAERDERLRILAVTLAEKEKAITESANKERATILDNLEKQLQDYKTKYIDGISQAFHHAGVDIKDFLSAINDQLAVEVQNTSNEIIRLVNELNQMKQNLGTGPGFIPTTPPLPVNPPTYPGTVIPVMPQFQDQTASGRPVSIQVSVTTPIPTTAQDIANEIRRGLILAG